MMRLAHAFNIKADKRGKRKIIIIKTALKIEYTLTAVFFSCL
jgi:hypothetical protein